jgi:hypothetical protein
MNHEWIRAWALRHKGQLITTLVIVGLVTIFYSAITMIVWNFINPSYGISFGFIAAVVYFVLMRLVKYFMEMKKHVIKKEE